MPHSSRPRRAALVCTVLLLATACSYGDDDKPPASTTAATSTTAPRATTSTTAPPPTTGAPTTTTEQILTTTPGLTAQQEDIAREVAEALTYVRDVGTAPDPQAPGLSSHFSDPMLSNLRSALGDEAKEGTHYEPRGGGLKIDITRVRVSGTKAAVDGCYVNESAKVETSTGAVLESEVLSATLLVYLEVDGGRWKISDFDLTNRRENAEGCQ